MKFQSFIVLPCWMLTGIKSVPKSKINCFYFYFISGTETVLQNLCNWDTSELRPFLIWICGYSVSIEVWPPIECVNSVAKAHQASWNQHAARAGTPTLIILAVSVPVSVPVSDQSNFWLLAGIPPRSISPTFQSAHYSTCMSEKWSAQWVTSLFSRNFCCPECCKLYWCHKFRGVTSPLLLIKKRIQWQGGSNAI